MKREGADVADAREQVKIDEAHMKDMALDQAVQQQQQAVAQTTEKPAQQDDKTKLTEPDTNQQWKEVEMDLNAEQNTYVSEKREEDKEKADVPKDTDLFETMKREGADVADAREQAKVDEAHAKDMALDQAVQQQNAAVQEERTQGRQVPEAFENISNTQASPTDESEYLP